MREGFRRSLMMKNSFPIVNLDNYVTSDYVTRNPDKVDYETYPIMEEDNRKDDLLWQK